MSQLIVPFELAKSRTRRANAATLLECSYNRYLAVAARAVRRSLKDDKRLAAERRGDSDIRFAKWEVSLTRSAYTDDERRRDADGNTARNRTASRATPRTWSRRTVPIWLPPVPLDTPREEVWLREGRLVDLVDRKWTGGRMWPAVEAGTVSYWTVNRPVIRPLYIQLH